MLGHSGVTGEGFGVRLTVRCFPLGRPALTGVYWKGAGEDWYGGGGAGCGAGEDWYGVPWNGHCSKGTCWTNGVDWVWGCAYCGCGDWDCVP